VKALENYEEWDVTIPNLPSRSRLYCLEPVGMGTPYIESLTSYIARLAEVHCVTPKNLIMREIMPLHSQTGPIMNYYYRLNKFWIENASALNGISPIARWWVEKLQSLTLCDNLSFLTMLMFNDVIALSRLLHRSKAWCSLCYAEWRLNHQVVYDPLLWSLNNIDVCLRHQQPLVAQCPYCKKTLPFLSQTTRAGYCSNCTRWLGAVQKSLNIVDISSDLKTSAYQYWVAKASGDLLAAAPNLVVPPTRKQIVMRIDVLLGNYANGSMSKLARLLGISIQSLWEYLHLGRVPYFDSLLKICFALSVTPLEFLTTATILPRKDSGFAIESIPTISRGKSRPATEDDVRRMQQVLEAVLAVDYQVDSFPYLKDIAQRMGFDEETVCKHCPDLAKAIKWRYKNNWAEEGHRMLMKQTLEKALASPEPGPLANIAQQLHCDTASMRKYFPELCHAVVIRYRKRFDDTLIEQRLREVLASNTETPAIVMLAREMGYGVNILRDKFPELCKQVSARRHAERRERRKEHMMGICKEIRHTAFLLHEQGIYPSARQVLKLLNDPHILRTKEGHEAWRLTLEELGYPTDKFKRYE
jgi:transcriptional regulator with XRE-family HTH domain